MDFPAEPEPLWHRLKRQKANADDVLRFLGISRPPVDVEAIARSLGVPVYREVLTGSSGEIHKENLSVSIKVQETEAPVRQRFTIAHELGHLLLHEFQRAHRDLTFGGSPAEAEANRFAADLLMPLWMFDAYAPPARGDVKVVAAIFQVSEQAAQLRLAKWMGLA